MQRARRRIQQLQRKGVLASNVDSGQLLLSMMALTAYPLAFPQIARLLTGMDVSSSAFQRSRIKFLRQFASAFAGQVATKRIK
jgi:hypothetical protein